MSSLAAARADNFYYPPDHDPKKGSRNKQLGQHHLRERAAKLASKGILVVRFELPFNCLCSTCGRQLAQGLRFNADKKQAGNYYSTKVWEFSMSVPCCGTRLVLRTDPKQGDFIVVSGARRRVVTKHDRSEDEEEESSEGEEGEEEDERPFSTSNAAAGPSSSSFRHEGEEEEEDQRKTKTKTVDALAEVEASILRGQTRRTKRRQELTAAEQRLRLREIADLRRATHLDDARANAAARAFARPARRADDEADARRAALGLPGNVRLRAEGPVERAAAAIAFAAAKRRGNGGGGSGSGGGGGGGGAAASSTVSALARARARQASSLSSSIFARSNSSSNGNNGKVAKVSSSIPSSFGRSGGGVVVVKKKK